MPTPIGFKSLSSGFPAVAIDDATDAPNLAPCAEGYVSSANLSKDGVLRN